ncbi:MAG: hypothetical protein HY901_19230 [Deltaproteobacteria bacterium]|nr:hypothetical protein [Deltaproteobacteria bacterium]
MPVRIDRRGLNLGSVNPFEQVTRSKSGSSTSTPSQVPDDSFTPASRSHAGAQRSSDSDSGSFLNGPWGKLLKTVATAAIGIGIEKLMSKLMGKTQSSGSAASSAAPSTGNAFPDASQLSFEPTTDRGVGAYKGTAAVLFPASWAGRVDSVQLGDEVAQMGSPHNGKPVFRFLKTGYQYSLPQTMTIKSGNQTYSMQVTQQMMMGGAAGTGSTQGTGTAGGDGTYANSKTYDSYGVRNGGRQAWRIPQSGPHFGQSCRITFEDGSVVNIPDTSKNFRIQSGKMRGFVFKPGPNNGYSDKARDTSTSHGGIYLHAPYGNSSKKATIEWN